MPVRYIKGLTEQDNERVTDDDREPFHSLGDFYRRVGPSPEEMESLLRAGAFDDWRWERG